MNLALLQDPGPDAAWLLDGLLRSYASAGDGPAWSHLSAFHLMRTRPPEQHPAHGPALLQWQRARARLGDRTPAVAARAFLALRRAAPGQRAAARILELWCRQVPLHIEGASLVAQLATLPVEEAALVAEDVALGAFEQSAPSDGYLQLVADLQGPAFSRARALAQLERAQRRQIDAGALTRALEGERVLPDVTAWLLGALAPPWAYVPGPFHLLGLALEALRTQASRAEAQGPHAEQATRILACLASLTPQEVVALAEPGRLAPPPRAALPAPDALAPALAGLSEEARVRLGATFPSLAGAVEKHGGPAGLVGWLAAQDELPPEARRRAVSVGHPDWARWTGRPPAAAPPLTPGERLRRALRTGEPLSTAELLAWRKEPRWGVGAVIFESPRGPGVLREDGQLQAGSFQWAAPEALTVAHPLDLAPRELEEWQARLLGQKVRSPVSQAFRECSTAASSEQPRKLLVRGQGGHWGHAGLRLLGERGWFPLQCPAEVAPTLQLGEWTAELVVARTDEGLTQDGVRFLRAGQAATLGQVPPRLFSEVWRDVDEGLALDREGPTWAAMPARAQLVRARRERLGQPGLRVESGHVALSSLDGPERISLAEGLRAPGTGLLRGGARALGAPLLPYADDGGVAAVLLGQLVWALQEGT